MFDELLKIIIHLLFDVVNSYFKVFRYFWLIQLIESAYNMIVTTKTKCEKILNFFSRQTLSYQLFAHFFTYRALAHQKTKINW